MYKYFYRPISFLPMLLLLFGGCSPLISPYDQYSYTKTTSLKMDALNIMIYATDNYSMHETEIKAINLNIEKQMEYEKHRPKNKFTNDQWSIITNPNGNLLGGFLNDWKNNKSLKQDYINAKRDQVSRAFDEIIKLESNKLK